MFDVALAEAGAQVPLATSSDENFPPENIIDGKLETFWATTGLFPQEFIISFTTMICMDQIKINCYQVKRLSIERSVSNEPTDFEAMTEKDLSPSDASLQMEEFQGEKASAKHLKFIIKSGYDHFVSVHKVSVSGMAVREQTLAS
ncbi:intraflagellar transport protein 25 homolog isoform X1 [Diadema setosum]|uniref:intraflagellar transport protein 25 homolog isoform X1 n=1 Tax=Diadema setosum TaxID=31175 RepID=UPI003B3BCBE8